MGAAYRTDQAGSPEGYDDLAQVLFGDLLFLGDLVQLGRTPACNSRRD